MIYGRWEAVIKYALEINFSKWLRNFQMLGATIAHRYTTISFVCNTASNCFARYYERSYIKMFIIPLVVIIPCHERMHSKNHSMKNEIYHSTRILIFCDFFIFELMQKARPESNFSIHFVNVSARGNILLSTSFRTI